MNNSFQARLYFLDGGRPAWLEYVTLTKKYNGAVWLHDVVDADLRECTTVQNNFELTPTVTDSYPDRFANVVPTAFNWKGKVSVMIDADVYNALVSANQNKYTNLVLLSEATGQGEYIENIMPTFLPTTKVGKMQFAEMSFEFSEPANPVLGKERHVLFNMTERPHTETP